MVQGALPPGPSFLPVPTALVTFRSAGGARRMLSVGWLGVVCAVPPLLTVCVRPGGDGRKLLRAGDLFIVNLPGEELLQALTARMGSGREGALASFCLPPPFVPGEDAAEGAALITACPVRIECRTRSLAVRFSQYYLRGEIVAVHLDGQRQEMPAPVDFCRLLALPGRRFSGLAASSQRRDVS
jgi:flavin reductase (DIM6/NTAB) family NADH-FMN oxidoreductase RutF